MEKEQITNLADKIAQLIASESSGVGQIPSAGMDAIIERLAKLEAAMVAGGLHCGVDPSRNPTPAAIHPSHQRFHIAEAIADAVFGDASEQKMCTFEPHNRPCDNCSMCSSRGF